MDIAESDVKKKPKKDKSAAVGVANEGYVNAVFVADVLSAHQSPAVVWHSAIDAGTIGLRANIVQ